MAQRPHRLVRSPHPLRQIPYMTTFQKQNIPVNTSCETLFSFLSDFRNLKEMMPEQVTNWEAGETSCSFTIQGLADLSMRIDAKYPCRNIRIVADGKNPVDYSLDYFFRKGEEAPCLVNIVFEVSLNPFLKSMASKPLQYFVDTLAEKLQEKFA